MSAVSSCARTEQLLARAVDNSVWPAVDLLLDALVNCPPRRRVPGVAAAPEQVATPPALALAFLTRRAPPTTRAIQYTSPSAASGRCRHSGRMHSFRPFDGP